MVLLSSKYLYLDFNVFRFLMITFLSDLEPWEYAANPDPSPAWERSQCRDSVQRLPAVRLRGQWNQGR